MTELKPCPFCGSDSVTTITGGVLGNSYSVTCMDCHVWVDHIEDRMSEEEAIELWNRRVKE